ncbi:MAG: hypothetical protein JWM78_3086 [Verrucomicrobiaceae bacterium]|nr:hypothetical protein [Verrucomicrobiaceae bacterium]
MSLYVGLNRRAGGDRRILDTTPGQDRRGIDRRRRGSDVYVLVMGDAGVDRFGLMVGFPVACLIAVAVIGVFAGA